MFSIFKKKETIPTTELCIFTQGCERRLTVPVTQVDNLLMFMSGYERLSDTLIELARPYAHAASVYEDNKLTCHKAILALRNSGEVLWSTWEKMEFLQRYHDLLIWAGDYEIPSHIFMRLDEMIDFFGVNTAHPRIPDWQML